MKKKAKATPATALSTKALRVAGFLVGRTERMERHPSPHRVDLFGFIDLIAVRGDETLGVQTTSATHLSNRVAKALALPDFALFCRGARAVEFHGWSKRGAAGKRKLWGCRVIRYENGQLVSDLVR